MKFIIVFLLLFFSASVLTRAQDSTSTAVIKEYEKKIKGGRDMKNFGGIILIAGAAVTLGAGFLSILDPMETTNSSEIAETAAYITLAAIPITLGGKFIEKSNRNLLRKYRRSLSMNLNMGNTPSIGFAYKF